MMKKTIVLVAVIGSVSALSAKELKISADRIAADRNSGSLVASGNVVAVSAPYRMFSECCTRTDNKITHLDAPTMITTCTNELGHLHWSLCGEAEHHVDNYVWMKSSTLRFWELPIFWLPYLYYPLERGTGWQIIPGYNSRWGAFLLNRYSYGIAGDRTHQEGSYWLNGATRFDLRSENGLALGQSFDWQLGDYGRGKFNLYYAWDEDASRYDRHWSDRRHWNYKNWTSDVPYDRYTVSFEHFWEMTERDTLRLSGALFSDSRFADDFNRRTVFGGNSRFTGYDGNELAWEHVELWAGFGASVSGPLNDFYNGTSRLPEFYFDVAPMKLGSLPINYESESKVGYLDRQYAKYGDGSTSPVFACRPGEWADFNTFRFDTYHRFTMPFRVDDVVSVVPRVAYHGTFWNDSGYENTTGWGRAGTTGDNMYRSIIEGGVTFAGRGVAEVSETWRHVLEPYFDVLLQEAVYSGDSNGSRPYVFDSIDASRDWSEQFAGRSRNLPYSYYGVTPGVRNAFQRVDEHGNRRTVFDFDVYAAIQFNDATYRGNGTYHKLAEVGDPNYGSDMFISPGVRARYFIDDRTMLNAYLEYDSDSGKIAQSGIRFNRRCSDDFAFYVDMRQCDYRWWDFSSTPSDPALESDDFNRMHFFFAEIGCEQDLCDAVAWSPFIRWDCREKELDSVGTWIDFRTDCLGFRFIVAYDNKYTRIDGSEYDEDFSVEFQVYLRCFGPQSNSIIGDRD